MGFLSQAFRRAISKKTFARDRLSDLRQVEKRLGYRFKDKALLNRALTHSSFANENQMNPVHESNERLEFLGDAVLELIISDMLLKEFPDDSEGVLSKIRADLVNRLHLARVAGTFDIGGFLLLGRGEEKTQGRSKSSILSNCIEALIGAMYLDGGYRAVFKCVQGYFADVLKNLDAHVVAPDFKTKLQEILQKRFKRSPRYVLVAQSGPDHSKTFQVAVEFMGTRYGRGKGRSKREAEQMAAEMTIKDCLDRIMGGGRSGSDDPPPPKGEKGEL